MVWVPRFERRRFIYLLGFKKWLYEDNTNNGAFALIDKGIKRIKKSTNFFEDLIKKD